LDTLIAATMIGPSKDPLPASSTPHMMILLRANSNPLIPNQDIVAILSLPQNHDILGAKSYLNTYQDCNTMFLGLKKEKQCF